MLSAKSYKDHHQILSKVSLLRIYYVDLEKALMIYGEVPSPQFSELVMYS